MKPLELFFFSTMCYSGVCFAWLAVVHFKIYIQYSFYTQFKALPFLYVWVKSVVKNSLQDKAWAGEKVSFSLLHNVNWFLYVLWRSVYLSTYQDSVVHFSLIQLEVFQFEYFVKTLLAHSERSALLKNVCYSIQLLPVWKITDSLWIQQRQGELCFAFWKQLKWYQRIWRGVTYQNAAIADVGKRAGIRGHSRAWLSAWDMDIYSENFGERQSRDSILARKIVSVAGRQVITGVVDEMILLFGKIAAVGSRKYTGGVTTLTNAVSGQSQNCSGNLEISPGIGTLGHFSGKHAIIPGQCRKKIGTSGNVSPKLRRMIQISGTT